jgi:tripartite-type tricarboxylate transporter receptor subunit TctC
MSKTLWRPWLALAAAALAWLAAPTSAHAAFPDRPIRVIIPFPPGGPNDQLARPLMQKLSEMLGQPFVVENRAGANGLIGAGSVVNAQPDGYTLLFMTGALTANVSIVAKMPFDPLTELQPITQVARTYGMMLVVRQDFPAKSLAEFVAMAKSRPGSFTYGNAGVGNPTHVAIELFKSVAGVDVLSVPYKGTGDTIPALLGGQIDLIGSSTVVGASYIKQGQMRALGITGEERASNLPEVPTFAEQGFPDVKLLAFYGMWYPVGVPRELVDFMQRSVKGALATPEMQKVIEASGLRVVASTPDEFARFLVEDVAYQATVNKRIGISAK